MHRSPSWEEMTTRLDALLDDLAPARSAHAVAIMSTADRHRAGAANLIDDTTFRGHDRR